MIRILKRNKLLVIFVINFIFMFALLCKFSFGQNQAQINLNINEISLTEWNSNNGILYKQVPGANLGAISFELIDFDRIAYLCNSSNEIIIVDKISGIVLKRFIVSMAPRDFVYSDGYFYVLSEQEVIQYDENGKNINKFAFPKSHVGVERLARFNNNTYLLLPSGNSLIIESNGSSVESSEREGWMTESGHFIRTQINGNNTYSINIIPGNDKSYEKTYTSDKKVAGVYVVGATNSRLVLDVQTFISENPISIERNLTVIELNSTGLGAIQVESKIPDCYFVLSNKDLLLSTDGMIFNMITAPQGVIIFSISETNSINTQDYPLSIKQTKYHFNDHLIQGDNEVKTMASIPVRPQITRNQIISNAIPYTSQTWTATSANIWNGISCGGKIIQTPSWINIGSNTSMPYPWGGWTSITAIQGHLNSGKSAGDNNTATTFGAEPSCAVGLDCSGFVSRAWALSSKYSTSTLPNISTSISLTQTQPGDIVNKVGDHTRLIETNYGNGNYRVIEASARDWRTSYFTYTSAQLSSYNPRQYDNVTGGGTIPGPLTLTLTPECNGANSQIRLNWTASSEATSYDIYRNGTLYESGITGLQYINSANISVGSSYSYTVQARNTAGSTNSNTQSAIVPTCSSSCPQPSSITVGQTINGSLTTSDCINVGKYYDAYTFSGATGQEIVITMSSTSSLDTYLYLLNASGTVIREDDDGGDGTNSRIPPDTGTFSLPATGTYTIRASSFELGATGSYSLTLTGGNVQPSISIDDISLTEGNSGVRNFVLNVSLSQPSNQTITVNYMTADGTANSGTDYQFISGTLTFTPNDTTEAIFIPVNGDTQVEPNETFVVNLSNPTNTTIADSQGIGTIINDDAAPSISIDDIALNEGNSGTANFVLNVNLSQQSSQTVTVNYTTSDGTANSGTDYQFTSGTLTFFPNDTTEAIFIPINGDTQIEPNETLFVNLSNPTNATFSDSQGVGTIINDDNPPIMVQVTVQANQLGASFSVDGVSYTSSQTFSWASGSIHTISILNEQSINSGTRYRFNGWSDGGSSTHTVATTVSPTTYTADLSVLHLLRMIANPSNGGQMNWVTETWQFRGSVVQIAAFPNSGYTFHGWNGVGSGSFSGSNNQATIFMNEPITQTAQFNPVTNILRKPFDYDGDGKSDVSVWRPSNGAWYMQNSTTGFYAVAFGQNGDKVVPADFSGDGRTDVAIYRPADNTWYVFDTSNNTFYGIPFGTNGDIPVPEDFDGDGKADINVFRPSTGFWFRNNSSNGQFVATPFGQNGDVPTVGDYDGDGKADIGVWRSSNGAWYRLNSSNNSFFAVAFGQKGDKVVPADYTGDGKTDIAVYRAGTWFVLRSEDLTFYGIPFGLATDIPSPGDFDGDGKADQAVYRNGQWFIQQSTSGFTAYPFGLTGDIPTPSAFVY